MLSAANFVIYYNFIDVIRNTSVGQQILKELGGWIVGDWSECDAKYCGVKGKQKRIVYCESANGCAGEKPITQTPCEKTTNECQYQWNSTPWSICNCTDMRHSRNNSCEATIENRIVDDSYCFNGDRPETQQPCSEDSCVKLGLKIKRWNHLEIFYQR